MKRHFHAEPYNLYEQKYPNIKETLLQVISKFWRFSIFYGKFISRSLEIDKYQE
jgi:hypothetical protein